MELFTKLNEKLNEVVINYLFGEGKKYDIMRTKKTNLGGKENVI